MFQHLAVLAIVQVMIISSDCRPYVWTQDVQAGFYKFIMGSGVHLTRPIVDYAPELEQHLSISFSLNPSSDVPTEIQEATHEALKGMDQSSREAFIQKLQKGDSVKVGCRRNNGLAICNFYATQ